MPALSATALAVTDESQQIIDAKATPTIQPTTLVVHNRSASTHAVLVNVPALHDATPGATVKPGDTVTLRVHDGGLTEAHIVAAEASGEATVDYWVAAVTRK